MFFNNIQNDSVSSFKMTVFLQLTDLNTIKTKAFKCHFGQFSSFISIDVLYIYQVVGIFCNCLKSFCSCLSSRKKSEGLKINFSSREE
jgi:hypothetical protein